MTTFGHYDPKKGQKHRNLHNNHFYFIMVTFHPLDRKLPLSKSKMNMPTWSYMNDTSERTVVYKAKPKSNTKSSVSEGMSPTRPGLDSDV